MSNMINSGGMRGQNGRNASNYRTNKPISLVFEKSSPGRHLFVLPDCDVTPDDSLPDNMKRKTKLNFPELSETELSRHYNSLAKQVYGVNSGFYPLGSCTMKYNPAINEKIASLWGFKNVHPLQPAYTVQGCLEALSLCSKYLCAITGMDDMCLQPAAGAHGELTGLLIIKAYHESRGDQQRTKVIVPDSAHGTNPASASMAGYDLISIPSDENGRLDLDTLRNAVGDDTAAFMLTNPDTLGRFNPDILHITQIVHEAGGLVYYDGANLNAIMGITRPGDMGFDVIHLNLHKTFSTPHGGGGPGSGPVGCKKHLTPFLPIPHVVDATDDSPFSFSYDFPQSIGKVKSFYGNFMVCVRALTYMITLGSDGIKEVSETAVLNANYLMRRLGEKYDVFQPDGCMHEFIISMENMKKDYGVSAMDIAKTMIDYGIHPPTMYFPLIVPEALMFEPTETESKETLDEVVEIMFEIYDNAIANPESMHNAPVSTYVRRLDEVTAARSPVLKYEFGDGSDNGSGKEND